MSPISLRPANSGFRDIDAFDAASAGFKEAVLSAFERIRREVDNDAVMFLLDDRRERVPIYAQREPSRRQQQEGGAPGKLYRGLWAASWPGYPESPHGLIWLFEVGVRDLARQEGKDLVSTCMEVLLHEFEHALQEDHVLEALDARARQRAAMAGRPGCGSCGGRR